VPFTYVVPSPTSNALNAVVTRQGSSTHPVRASAPPPAPPPGRAPRPGFSVTGPALQSGASAYPSSEMSQVPFRRRPGPDSLVRAPQVYDCRDEDAPMSSTAAALTDHFGNVPGAASVTNGGIPSAINEGTETPGPDPTHADSEAAIVEMPWDGYDAARSDPLTRVKKRGGEEWICPDHGPICIPRICKAVGRVEHDERWKKGQEERDEKKKKWKEKMERRAQRKAQQAADVAEGDDVSRDQGSHTSESPKPCPPLSSITTPTPPSKTPPSAAANIRAATVSSVPVVPTEGGFPTYAGTDWADPIAAAQASSGKSSGASAGANPAKAGGGAEGGEIKAGRNPGRGRGRSNQRERGRDLSRGRARGASGSASGTAQASKPEVLLGGPEELWGEPGFQW